jgi:hypothetical protein
MHTHRTSHAGAGAHRSSGNGAQALYVEWENCPFAPSFLME